jgi:WD40 repeat protein
MLRDTIEANKGYIFKMASDAFYAAFASPNDALQAAFSIQQAQHRQREAREPSHLSVRVALHGAISELLGDDHFGPPLTHAARLLSAAHGGQVLLSLSAQQLVRDALPGGVQLLDLGAYCFKGPERVERVFQLVSPELPSRFPPLRTLRSPGAYSAEGEPTEEAITEFELGIEIQNPYKGLRAFQEADAGDFFGREALTQRLLARLGETGPAARFLAVVGPSGSGKSSVVRAGVVPLLRQGALPGSGRWLIAEMLPGAHPMQELEVLLSGIAANRPPDLMNQLQADEQGLVQALQSVLPPDETVELVLVIDQFEEVFTLAADERTRVRFLELLQAAVVDPLSRLRLIITLRADFYDRPLLYSGFSELIRERTEVVVPLAADELERAIARPAARVGVRPEAELIPAIVRDVGEQPGALPLLEYALTELFKRREGKLLTLGAYRASGGMLGALPCRADDIYAGLSEQEQEAARQLFLRLVTPGEGVEDTRRRVRLAELISLGTDAQKLTGVLEAFGSHRLLTFDRDPLTGGPTVEVAHEALLRTWGRLREWLDASRAALHVQRQLGTAAEEWSQTGQEASYLARGARLAQFETLAAGAAEGAVALTGQERAYLTASVAERDQQEAAEQARQKHELELAWQSAAAQRQAANWLRVLIGGLALFLLVAIGLMLFAMDRQGEAEHNAATAIARRSETDAQRKLAVASQATAVANENVAQANFTRAEAQRLAADANVLLQERGDPMLIALLSLRAMHLQYSPQGDTALAAAAIQDYPRTIYAGHTDQVRAVAFSPDGKVVLTGSTDKTARLWHAQGGQQLPGPRFVHTGTVLAVAFAPDGKTLLTSTLDDVTWSSHSVQLWDAITGRELRRFTGHTDWVCDVAYAPDGKTALTAGVDKTARLWDVQTGQELRRFTGHTNTVRDLALAPDGKTLLTGSYDHTARLWDVQTGQELRTLTGHTDEVHGVAFAPDGKSVLTGSFDKTARLWDVQTGQELRRFTGHEGHIIAVAFSPDGRTMLTSSDDKTARLWDVQTGQELRRLTGHGDTVNAAAFSPDGQYIVTASYDWTARLWDAEAHPDPPLFAGHSGAVNVVAVAPDGQTLLTGSADTTARLWDVRGGAPLRILAGHAGEISDVAYAPDGRTLATAGHDNTARLWDAQTGQELRAFTNHTGPVNSVVFSPDGRYVLTASDDNTARMWDAATGKELHTFTGHFYVVFRAVFSPDGKYVLTTGGDWDARLWDVQTGETVGYFSAGDSELTTMAVLSPDGKAVLAGYADHTARLWDVQTGKEVRRFTGHAGAVTVVAFSPGGRYVLTGSRDKTARLWDAATGEELRLFAGHTDTVDNAEFSPDGRYVLTGSADQTARLWDAVSSKSHSGQELRRFAGHTGEVNTATFAPDGQHVLTASSDGTARLWDMDYHTTMDTLCARLLRDFTEDERAQYEIKDREPTCPRR